jgi:trk system potassium uptake protein TrkA
VKIVIVGCGRVGAAIAETYDRNGQQVLILDISTAAFDRLPSSFSGEALRGDGTDEDVLRRAGAEGADVFLAVTEGDNRNVMAAQLASEAFGIGRVIAKINDPVRAAAYSELGIATLCRTGLMMDAIAGYLGLAASGLPGMLAPTGTHHDPSHGLLATVGSALGSAVSSAGGSSGAGGSSAAAGSAGAGGTSGSAGPRVDGSSGNSSASPGARTSSTASGGSASASSRSAGSGFASGGPSGAPSGGNGASRFFGASRFLGGSRTAASSTPGATAGTPVDPAAPTTRREV